MARALVIGGTGFVGRHAVANLDGHGYDVTSLGRGGHPFDFDDWPDVEQRRGDRTDPQVIEDVARGLEPDVVVDCAAFHPSDVRRATEAFADADAYVLVSSGGAYADQDIPKREDETRLHDCTPEQAADDTMATYGPRKAECDRIAREAAERGVAATSVRSTVVYGPQTISEAGDGGAGWADKIPAAWTHGDAPGLQSHHDYWIHRVARHDRVVVPGDGTAIWHRVFVGDLAEALRVVAERGVPGEAYNAADRTVCTLADVVALIAGALDTDVEVVKASERDLANAGLDPGDFPLYHHPMTGYPHVLDTCKLASLGWESTPPERAIERTVEESIAGDRDGSGWGPERDVEERLLDAVDG